MSAADLEIVRDEEAERWVARGAGEGAFLRYSEVDERTLDFEFTFVPPELRHAGIGERVVVAALEDARRRGCRVIPSCGFVGWVVERNPEYRELLK